MNTHECAHAYACMYRVQMRNQALWRGRRRPSLGWQVSGSRQQIFGPSGCLWMQGSCLSFFPWKVHSSCHYIRGLLSSQALNVGSGLLLEESPFNVQTQTSYPLLAQFPLPQQKKLSYQKDSMERIGPKQGSSGCWGGGVAVQLALPSKPWNPELQRP